MPPESEDLMQAWEAAIVAADAKEATTGPLGVDQPVTKDEPANVAKPAVEGKTRNEKGQFQPKGDKANDPTQKPEPAAPSVEGGQPGASKPTAAAKLARDADAKPAGTGEGESGQTLEQLTELAKKHGFVVEANKVTPRERAAFREERRQSKAALDAERQAFEQQKAQAFQQINTQGAAVIAAAKALQADDFDGFARALGHKDWNALNGHAVNVFADPSHKRMLELERREQERERAVQQQRELSVRTQQEQLRAQEIANYKTDLSKQMSNSSDPLTAAMFDDPAFVDAVFRVQQGYFQETGDSISVEEAVRLKPRNGGSPVIEHLRGLHKRLQKAGVFQSDDGENEIASGPRSTENSASTKVEGHRSARSPARNAGKTSISQKDAAEAAGTVDLSDNRAFMKYAREQMEAAAREEELERRRRKSA